MEHFVNYDTALLAQKKGFDLNTGVNCWVKTLDGKIIHNSEKDFFDRYKYYLSQPSLTELQLWLMNEKWIRVFVNQKVAGDFGFNIYIKNPDEKTQIGIPWIRLSYLTTHYPTYNESLKAGLVEGLKLIEE